MSGESAEQSKIQEELLRKAMKSMGYNPDSQIPLANASNMSIFQELQSMYLHRTELQQSEREIIKRVEKVHQHLQNATVCITYNLKLLNAYQSDMTSELHRCKIAEREHSKLLEDHKNVDKESEQLKEYISTTENELCKRKEGIDKLTGRIKWAKTALIEWHEATEDSNKGTQLIEKYFKEDMLRAKQQDQRRQVLQHEIDTSRKTLIKLYDEQKCLEQNLQCTAKLYRSAHLERREMVDTWKAAVNQMIQREQSIHKGDQKLALFQMTLQKKKEMQKKYNQQLNTIIANNQEVEAAIDELNTETSEIKEQIQLLMDMVILKENEVELLQKELQNLSSRVQQQRAENRKSAKEKQDKQQELQNFTEVLAKLEERNAAMADKNLSAQQRLQILEDMNDVEEKAQYQITKEINRINDLIYRATQQLSKFKNDQKTLEMSSDAFKVNTQAILKSSVTTEKELKRKVELHYNLGFKCLEIERQIIKFQGGSVDPEVEQHNKELLAQLEEDYAKMMRRLHLTESQNKKLDDNMRNLTQCYNNDIKELEKISFLVKEAQVYCEGGVKRLKVQNQDAQVLIVELSILKMRADDFENDITKCNTSYYNLEKHRLKLERTIKDRIIEIKSQVELLYLKRKHLNEEKSTLRADVGERNNHIKVVRARFELTAKLLGTNDDGTMVTATQLRVETAQEKQLLLEDGNELNKKVLIAEEEVKALENTLIIMNNANDSFRKNFQTSDDKDEAMTELKTLQVNYCKALSSLKNLRNKLLQIDNDLGRACEEKQDLLKRLNAECQKRDQIKDQLTKLQKELNEQKVKIQRADREVRQAVKIVKTHSVDDEFLTLYDKDLDLREVEHINLKTLNQLVDLAEGDDTHGPRIIKMILDRGLKLPHHLQRARSRTSWRSDLSEVSISSRMRLVPTTSRSSASEESQTHMETSSAVFSIVSIDFPG